LIVASTLAAIVATSAFAGDDMAGMNMSMEPSAYKNVEQRAH
jgi:hypothetical protein